MSRGGPGSATTAEVARHWSVSAPVARRILQAAGLRAVGPGRPRYRWADIWRLEGAYHVPPAHHAAFKAALLCPGDLPEIDPAERSARTWRRYIAAGRVPAIRLAAGIVRLRPAEIDAALDHV